VDRIYIVNNAADALSRIQTSGASLTLSSEDLEVPVLAVMVEEDSEDDPSTPTKPDRGPRVSIPEEGFDPISLDDLFEAQVEDEWCRALWKTIDQKVNPGLVEEDGLLRKEYNDGFPPKYLAPESLRERILTLGHYPRLAGHPGSRRLAKTVGRTWFWLSMARDCALFVRRCPSCQAARLQQTPKRTVPLCLFPPSRPLEFIAVDILGPLPKTKRGNR